MEALYAELSRCPKVLGCHLRPDLPTLNKSIADTVPRVALLISGETISEGARSLSHINFDSHVQRDRGCNSPWPLFSEPSIRRRQIGELGDREG